MLQPLAHRSIEKPTLIERFVQLIPLPYVWAALVWSIILPTGALAWITQYVASGTNHFLPNYLENTLLNLLLPFYLFVMVRYIRIRVVNAEQPISRQLSGGEQEYHRAFGKMTDTIPVVLLAIILGGFILITYFEFGILIGGPIIIILNIIIVSLNALAFSTYLWEFATTN
jgi:hypothetical protein